LAVLTWPPC